MRLRRPAAVLWRALLVLALVGTVATSCAPLATTDRTAAFFAISALAAVVAAAGWRQA